MAVLPPDPVFCMRATDMGAVNCICFHSTERLFSGTAKGAVYLWDMQVSLPFLDVVFFNIPPRSQFN